MANSTTNLPTVSASQASKEVTVNALFDAHSPASLFGRNAVTTSALTWGYLGGCLNVAGTPTQIANGTVSLTGSATNYVEATTAGVVSANTSAFTAGRLRLYTVVCGASSVTGYTDHRSSATGAGIAGGAGSVTSVDITAPAAGITASGGPITSSGSITLALANDLAALEGLSGTGVPERTGTDTWALRTLDTDGTLAANSDTRIATQKATKTYVDAKVAGLSWKQAVRAATTAAGTLATSFENADVIDGVTLATGDRILVKNQATASENGIYVVAATGAPTRATDADAGAELVNATVYVSEGTTLADTQWTCSTNAPITVGTTSLSFAQLTAGGGGTPGGSDTQVQFNDGGAFGGATRMLWDKTNNILTVGTTSAGAFTAQGATGSTSTTVGAAVSWTGGTGGTDGGNGTTGGAATLQGGAGGAATNGGAGGAVTVQGGTAGGGTAVGGAVTVQGGTSTGTGAGALVTIKGGASATGTSGGVTITSGTPGTSGDTGAININTANGIGTNKVAGNINVQPGTGNNGMAGATVNITGGTGGPTNGVGGASTLKGGAGQGSGTGGDAIVQGGNSGATNADGGNVLLKGGTPTGTGDRGQVAVDNGGALATTSTGGFFCIPTCAGAPTGTPANVPTGAVAMVFDTTNLKLYAYTGGAWKSVTLA